MSDNNEFYKWLKYFRKQAHITQEKLSEFLNVSIITIKQMKDTNVDAGYYIHAATAASSLLLSLVKKKIASTLGVIITAADFMITLYEGPAGTYSTFEVSIEGTTAVESCGVISMVDYIYSFRFLYVPNGNNKNPYLYVERSRFSVK